MSNADERRASRASIRLRVFGTDIRSVVEALRATNVERETGTSILTCSVEETAPTLRVLLGFADSVEVLAPPALRHELAQRVRRAGQIYANLSGLVAGSS
jgi:predicted DNA-binding transcriptional regulator YafY